MKVFEKEVSTTLNADEAVARGCALQCAMLSPTFRVREFVVNDATPYPVVLTWKSQNTEDEGYDRFLCMLISLFVFCRMRPLDDDNEKNQIDTIKEFLLYNL